MVKKYYVDKSSIFANSIILPFYESDDCGFIVDGLDDSLKRELFNPKVIRINNKTNLVDSNSLSSYCYAVYLDDKRFVKALLIYSKTKKLYYCFRSANKDDFAFRFQNNYVSSDSKALETDYEKSLIKKGVNKFAGNGDFSKLSNVNYFDTIYDEIVNSRIKKESDLSRLIFSENNKFTTDFINLVDCNVITIENKSQRCGKALNLNAMAKLKTNRKDCLLVNFSTGNIDYFIYTYRPFLVNRYLLFKNLGKDRYSFVADTICFNKLLLMNEMKNLSFKNGSDFASRALSKMDYNSFSEKYYEFSEDEKIDEEFNSEWLLLEQLKQDSENNQSSFGISLASRLKDYGCELKDNIIYFKEYEIIPLGSLGENHIRIKQNRILTDSSLTNQLSLKDFNKIEQVVKNLLHNKPSSRLLALEKLIENLTKQTFDALNNDQLLLIKEIEDNIKTLWATDKEYPKGYFKSLLDKYNLWKNGLETGNAIINSSENKIKDMALNNNVELDVTLHASLRIDERIGKMSDIEKKKLAVEAYLNGFNSVHFYESDRTLFCYLQYQQNKYPGKTLRLYNDYVYIFSLAAPHDLVTCFKVEENYKRYIANRR